MKFTNTEIFNFEAALRGARNPLESWNKSDTKESIYKVFTDYPSKEELYPKQILGYCGNDLRLVEIGENDLKLAQRLILAGSDHRKFMRQIFVSVDITAPLYWWKEMDQYRINVTSNSESTMHRLSNTPITLDHFEMEDFEDFDYLNDNYDFTAKRYWEVMINALETLRKNYLETKDKKYWKELIRILPSSWLQKRTITMNYENILSIIGARENHKLIEWSVDFINWCHTLPYTEELLFIGGDN